MALEVAVHVDDRFLDFTRVELVDAADLVEEGCDLLRGVAGKGLHFFLVDEVPDLLHHLVLRRDDEAVEHVLVVLVEVVVQLFLDATHDVELLGDFLGQLRGDVIHYFIDFLAHEEVDLGLLVPELLS